MVSPFTGNLHKESHNIRIYSMNQKMYIRIEKAENKGSLYGLKRINESQYVTDSEWVAQMSMVLLY